MDRQLILNTLLADGAITNLVEVANAPQIYLWMTTSPEVFPRIVVRELDVSMQSGADDLGAIVRKGYEISLAVKTAQPEVFMALCELVPAAMARIGLRHSASTPDAVIPEHAVVVKAQQYETYEYVEIEEED